MCCNNDIHMLNGRLYDDIDGNITCISNKGKSLVDYIIALTSLFDKCSYFYIGTQKFSDNFPVICKLHAWIQKVLSEGVQRFFFS